MHDQAVNAITDRFQQLETLIDALFERCHRLEQRNKQLMRACDDLAAERDGLVQEYNSAQLRIEKLVARAGKADPAT